MVERGINLGDVLHQIWFEAQDLFFSSHDQLEVTRGRAGDESSEKKRLLLYPFTDLQYSSHHSVIP